MRAEIQIRTNGMDFWATLEHQLRYKQNIEEMDGYEDVSNELLNCARTVIDMDNEMQADQKQDRTIPCIFKKTGEAVTASPVLSHCFSPGTPVVSCDNVP